MGEQQHRITTLRADDDAGDAFWECSCGEQADAYDSVAEARYAAAEHQLPERIQAGLPDPSEGIEWWRHVVLFEADAEAGADPQVWRWYLDTAGKVICA